MHIPLFEQNKKFVRYLTLPCMMSLMVSVTLGLASTGRLSMEAELAIMERGWRLKMMRAAV